MPHAQTPLFNCVILSLVPRYTNAKKDLHIHHLPEYAIIASAAFERVPAVYKNRSAHDYYKDLAKEYFLQ